MFDALDNIGRESSIGAVIISILAIFISGIFFASVYMIMNLTQSGLESMDCVIENNIYVESCQDLFSLSIYPFLALKEILVWFSFFFIFALVLGLLVLGYKSGKSPIMLGVLIVFVIVLTYLGIEISNVYRTMLENEVFRNMMLEFDAYNTIMLKFPFFVFFVGLLSVILSIVNFQRTNVNSGRDELNY